MTSTGAVLLGVSSAWGISGLTQNRKNTRSPESLISRGCPSESAVPRERSVCKTWCQWLHFHLLTELKRATDSSEGHLLPFGTTAREIDFFFSRDLIWHQKACWCLLLSLGGLYPKGPMRDTFIGLLLCEQSKEWSLSLSAPPWLTFSGLPQWIRCQAERFPWSISPDFPSAPTHSLMVPTLKLKILALRG